MDKNIAKHWVYQNIFNHKSKIMFGYPGSAMCDKCRLFNAKIKAVQAASDDPATCSSGLKGGSI